MIAQEVIIKKRDKNELSREEILFFVEGVISGKISHKQAVAFLMAFFINGISPAEITNLTQIMTETGFKFDFSKIKRPIIDKHSTGGIGDKVSIILLPILIDLGISVPMISGRGLGHTGGTLDKLESIVGLFTSFTEDEAYTMMEKNNGFIISQTENIAPADKIFYSLRDECGIVDNIGLIVSSILSKKLSEDIQGLTMDIKVGNGAFMTSLSMAEELGSKFMDFAKHANFPLTIVYSDMNEPLGKMAGNWLEIVESIDFLKGKKVDNRLKDVTYESIIQCVLLSGFELDREEIILMIEDSINSGRAYEIFEKIITSQGGHIENSYEYYKNTQEFSYIAKSSGYIQYDTYQIGLANYQLGYKNNPGNLIDYSAGFEFNFHSGDFVNQNDEVLKIKGFFPEKFEEISSLLDKAITFSDIEIEKRSSIIKVVN